MAELGSSTVYGDLNVSGQIKKESKIVPNITISTSSPSGGSHGDMWLQV